MKIIFLALLLLNLGVLAWHAWVAPAAQKPLAAPTSAAAARVARVTPDPKTPPAVCAELGPFPDQASAEAAATELREQGQTFRIKPRDVTATDSYRVYFPPFPTSTAAQDMADRLRRAGVSDVYVIPGGDQRNAISVGVFKDQDGAERRRQHLGSLGFEPRVGAYTRHRESRYWIHVETAPAADLLGRAAVDGAGKPRIVGCTHIAAAATNS